MGYCAAFEGGGEGAESSRDRGGDGAKIGWGVDVGWRRGSQGEEGDGEGKGGVCGVGRGEKGKGEEGAGRGAVAQSDEGGEGRGGVVFLSGGGGWGEAEDIDG